MRTIGLLFFVLLLSGCVANRPSERREFHAHGAYPEGVVYDATRKVYYVSSARLGTVGRVDLAGGYNVVHSDTTLRSTYGIKLHPDGERVFVCAGDANYSKYTTADTRKKMCRLVSIDVGNGRKVGDVDLSGLVPGPHFPNDLCFDGEGNAYVTDSYANVIYRVSSGGTASVLSSSEVFKTKGVGLNGIVWHPHGFLLVASGATGSVYKVPLSSPQNVQKVRMPYFFMNADGLLLPANDTLTLVQNGGVNKIYQLVTEDNWQSAEIAATTLGADRFAYPSTATMKEGEVWVMNAKFHELGDSTSVPSKEFSVQRAVFRPIPKKLRR